MAHLEHDQRRSTTKSAYRPLNQGGWLQYLNRLPRKLSGNRVALFIALIGLFAWEWTARRQMMASFYFSTPTIIATTTFKLLVNGSLIAHLSVTLQRVILGGLIGSALGLALGLLMGWSNYLRAVLEPFVAALHPLPKIAILPLIMVIFGVGERSMIIVVATGAFFPLLINTMAGVTQINPTYFDVARSFQTKQGKLFQRVIWPGSLPGIFTGLRLAFNTALLLGVAVEMVSATDGLGSMIWLAWSTMRVEEIYVSLLVITLLGLLINGGLNYLTARFIPWQEKPQSR